jgi:choline transporter-like protein 2/4/5
MPLCCGSNQVAPDGEKLENIVDKAERRCTDVLCFLLFIVMWILWIILAILAFTDGCGSASGCNTPMRLVYGYDSKGNQCGSGDLSSMKTMFVGNPADAVGSRVCLSSCPSSMVSISALTISGKGAICVDVNGKFTTTSTAALAPATHLCMLQRKSSDCCYLPYPTKEIMFKCVPDISNVTSLADSALGGNSEEIKAVTAFTSNPQGQVGIAFAQIVTSWPILIGAVVLALIIGFVFLLALRIFVMPIVVTMIFSLLIILAGLAIFFWNKAGLIEWGKAGINGTSVTQAISSIDEYSSSVALSTDEARVLGGIFSAITGLYLLFMLVMFKNILRAVNIIREATKCLAQVPSMLFYPLVTCVFAAIALLWFLFILIYLASAGEFDAKTMSFTMSDYSSCRSALKVSSGNWTAVADSVALQYCSVTKGDITKAKASALVGASFGTFNASAPITADSLFAYKSLIPVQLNSDTYNYFILYNIFGFLWTYAFVSGLGFLVIAGTVSRWYFEADKKKLTAPLLKSMTTAIRYHMGSVAFGSLILAIVQVIRIVFNYIVDKSQKAKDNPAVKLLICCINCMLACLERFVKFLNTNA